MQRSFAGNQIPECCTGLMLESPNEDGSHVLLLDRTFNDTESLGHSIGLIKLKLLLLCIQRVSAVVQGVPDDPGHLGDAGLGLLSQGGHDGAALSLLSIML